MQLVTPRSLRLERILADYAHLDDDALTVAIGRISDRLGARSTRRALEAVHSQARRRAAAILLDYYDRAYAYQAQKAERRIMLQIATKADLEPIAHQLMHYAQRAEQ
jgi:tRNA 2-selenouridine synthase